MGPALSANYGFRGKIQLRCRQGCRASALSQRQSVTPLICATIPRATTSRWSSGMVQRANGASDRLGSSQASRLTSTTTLGGKAGSVPATWLFVQAGQPVIKESLPPFAHDLAGHMETRGDHIVAQPGGSHEDDLCANDVAIRRRILTRPCLQGRPLLASDRDAKGALPRHLLVSRTTGVSAYAPHVELRSRGPSNGPAFRRSKRRSEMSLGLLCFEKPRPCSGQTTGSDELAEKKRGPAEGGAVARWKCLKTLVFH